MAKNILFSRSDLQIPKNFKREIWIMTKEEIKQVKSLTNPNTDFIEKIRKTVFEVAKYFLIAGIGALLTFVVKTQVDIAVIKNQIETIDEKVDNIDGKMDGFYDSRFK